MLASGRFWVTVYASSVTAYQRAETQGEVGSDVLMTAYQRAEARGEVGSDVLMKLQVRAGVRGDSRVCSLRAAVLH